MSVGRELWVRGLGKAERFLWVSALMNNVISFFRSYFYV
jgi:hypothetical protein